MKFETTVVYKYMEQSYKKKASLVVHQGGTRSSKTYNILIWLIFHCLVDWNNEIIDIGRKSFPSLRASVMFDFFEILRKYNLYFVQNHNKSEHTYILGTNVIRFFSVDQETKIRGSKRSYLFLNEANEFKHDDFKQLNQRTTKMTILDFNPSDEFHWIYEDVLKREDVDFYKTTFRDNHFLDARIKNEIYSYKDKDPNYWRIYGLGEKGVSESTVFVHWKECKELQNEGQEVFGMDFGYNDPTTLVKTRYSKGLITTKELLYKTHLTSEMIVGELLKLEKEGHLTKTSTIYADSARPEVIQEIKKAGFNIHPVEKEKGSIIRGINFMKKNDLQIETNSVNMIKEFRNYKWKVDKENKVLDEPVDVANHTIDAVRYSLDRISKEKAFVTPMVAGAKIF